MSSVGLVEQNVLCRGKQIQQRHIVTHRSIAHVNEQNNQPTITYLKPRESRSKHINGSKERYLLGQNVLLQQTIFSFVPINGVFLVCLFVCLF